MKTLSDAFNNGYVVKDWKYQRGYVSRKIPMGDCLLKVAGGSRKGELYALIPCWKSTQYCMRLYLQRKQY